MSKIALFFLFLLFCCVNLLGQSATRLLVGKVAVNQNKIAFTYAGKIWLVDRNGGAANRLTDTSDEETSPVFSPDGGRIAFSRFNGNDWDVFVIETDGKSDARQVTMMPASDFAVAWTPDAEEIVFETARDEEGINRFYKMRVDGGSLAEPLPLPQAMEGSFAPDGKSIAYNPRNPLLIGEWRYYRGGMTTPIWITNLQTGATEKLPNQNFNDRLPVWIGEKIYFTSDRTGIYNLFVYDRKTKLTEQLTKFDRQGIRSMAATTDAAVFVQDGRIHLFDLAKRQDRIVNFSVSPDTTELLPRSVSAMRFLQQFLPAADGGKIVLSTRGEVLLFDTASGNYKNLTNTSGAAERYATISPDGKSVAYFSDESGEYALHIRSLENDSVKKIPIEKQPNFYWNLMWSPDSKKLAFADRRLSLWLADGETETATKIDASDYSAQEDWATNFSSDSRFLTYAKRLKNRAGTVFIYDSAQKKSFQITDGKTHAESPVFDANGKYLYFISSPNALTGEFRWGTLVGILARPLIVRRVHAFILSKDTPPPFLPDGQPNTEVKVSDSAPLTKVDFDAVEKRFVNLPLPLRDYAQLLTGKAGKVFLAVGEWNKTPGDFNWQGQTTSLYLFNIAKGGEMQKIVEGIGGFDLTANKTKLLYGKGRSWFLVNAETAPKADEGKLDLSKLEVKINPGEEWRQIFYESLRMMRDWFYDPNYHGQNLKALEHYYAAYLPAVTRRSELNALMARMLGSISVGHLDVYGGDTPPPSSGSGNRIGLLGADYAIENGHYRFKKIYRSASYASPVGNINAPLDQPNINIREGDYLLEAGGQKIETSKNIFSYFENTAGKPTRITVSENPDGGNPRSFTVYPVTSENRLRRANWAENNRRLVEKLSGGKLGYIFIETYDQQQAILNAVNGLTGNSDKAGIIIDQRFNSGGMTPDYLIEWMQRKPLYHYMFRGGSDLASPINPLPPVKVLLINEWNGSAAETGAFMFKLGKVGTVVGKRTVGAGIGGYFFMPRLVDNGIIQIPNRAAYKSDGISWGIENMGVAPDLDVEMMPADLIAGRDSQLEKAIATAMAQIIRNPLTQPKRPPFPIHPGKQEIMSGGSTRKGSFPVRLALSH
jgi:tricorn protease